MVRRAAKPSVKTAGQRLIAEMSREDDPFSVQMLIDQAAHAADMLGKYRALVNGDVSAWCELSLGPQVVEVRIDSAARELRMLTTELRHLLAEIHKQRADLPMGPDDDDPLKRF